MKTKTCKDFAKEKYLLAYLLVLSGALTACGEDKKPQAPLTCESLAGQYTDILTLETLNLLPDCSFNDSVCAYAATYTPPVGGVTDIDITYHNGYQTCMPVGQYTCGLNYDGRFLSIDCGPGQSFTFLRR